MVCKLFMKKTITTLLLEFQSYLTVGLHTMCVIKPNNRTNYDHLVVCKLICYYYVTNPVQTVISIPICKILNKVFANLRGISILRRRVCIPFMYC